MGKRKGNNNKTSGKISRSKTPVISGSVEQKLLKNKTPVIDPSFSREHSTVSWKLGKIDLVGPFKDPTPISIEKTAEILQKLQNFETMTAKELFVDSKKQHHKIPCSQLIKEAQERLLELHQDDVECLHTLRLSNLERIWTIRQGNYLHLLWWDPEHKICPSTKRNT